MVKKPTLIVLLCAIVLGAAVYYFDWKKGSEKKPDTADASKPAFTGFQASDIASFTISHPAQPSTPAIQFEKRDGVWRIVQPVSTEADQPTAGGIVDQIADARVAQTEPGSEDRRKAYGLDPAQISVDFKLANGATHTILLGNQDFTNEYAYALVDGGQSVSLLPQLLATSAGKSLDDMRDRAVLHLAPEDIHSIDLKNSSGDVTISKADDQWKIEKPEAVGAGHDAVDSLLEAVNNAKIVSIASETPDNLAKYGLASPGITFSAANAKGQKATLMVGKKDGNAYFARDDSRPTIFRIDADLEGKLAQKFGDLRDKQILHADTSELKRFQLQTARGSFTLVPKPSDPAEWIFDSPADQKGKVAASWKVLDPLGTMQAAEVIDHPSPAQLAQLSNPAVHLTLTGKDGKDLNLRVSNLTGDTAYAQVDGNPALFKIKKSDFDQLNVTAGDLSAGNVTLQ
ncbi:MAG TPA: DUF4340 domain-containing protein [Candidatus Acidoferrales bacterium]|nr:DUF4340 domain-containing protein [Candidatus Acidoferrales bacterium]